MTKPPLLVVSLEGLAASALGCYGSSWNETPAIDRLASTGFVWDRFLATSDQPADVLADWTNRDVNWARHLRSSVGPIALITDSEWGAFQEGCFDEITCLANDPPRPDARPAADIEETQFGQLVAAAIERDASDQGWGAIWIHSRFLTRCWDAPLELALCDEDVEPDLGGGEEFRDDADEQDEADQSPPVRFTSIVPPAFDLTETSHPDLITAWMRTYGCQIRLVDLLLDILLQAIQPKAANVVVVGTSGFRLGQGGAIGHRRGPLRSPDIRLPLIISRGGPLHVPHLTPSGQLATMLDRLTDQSTSVCPPSTWCKQSKEMPRIEIASDRAAIAVSDASWFYVQDADHSEHLFLKPDDVDDFNDIGRLRDDVIEMLRPENRNGPADH